MTLRGGAVSGSRVRRTSEKFFGNNLSILYKKETIIRFDKEKFNN